MIPSPTGLILSLLIFLNCQNPASPVDQENFIPEQKSVSADTTIHVFVALCDNINQGIVPVPAKIGNGQDPHNNLYWGCGYGVRTFFKRSPDWEMISKSDPPEKEILERCVFRHKSRNVYLIADAYDGAEIRDCIDDFLMACSGISGDTLKIDSLRIHTGGDSRLLAYVGHDGLMEFNMSRSYSPVDTRKRGAIVLACTSKSFFGPYVKETGAEPLVWTTGFMAPEAYSLEASIASWLSGGDAKAMRNAAAYAYSKYQKCSMNAALRLFDGM